VTDYYTNLRDDSDDRAAKRLKPSNKSRVVKRAGDIHDLNSDTLVVAAAREGDNGAGPRPSRRSALCPRTRSINASIDMDMTAKSKLFSSTVEDRNNNAELAEANMHPLSQYADTESSDGDDTNPRIRGRQSLKTVTPSFLTERGMKKVVYEEMRSDWLSRTAPPVLSLVCLSNGRASREATAAMFKGIWGVPQREKDSKVKGAGEGKGVSGLHDWLMVTFAQDWVGMQCPKVHSSGGTGYKQSCISSTGAAATINPLLPSAETQGSNIISQCPNISAVDIEFKGEEEDTRLLLCPFEGRRSSNNSNRQGQGQGHGSVPSSADVGVDLYLNIGGPIWALAFAPHTTTSSHPSLSPKESHDALSSSGSLQFLAVGTSRVGWEKSADTGASSVGNDAQYAVGGRTSTPNLLQIWCLNIGAGQGESSDSGQIMMNRAASGNSHRRDDKMDTAVLSYCVALTRGPVWKVAWSSWSPCIDLERDRRDGDRSSFLGVLAVVCGDGSCLILVLPRSIPPSISTPHGDADPPSGPAVVDEHSVCRWVLTVPAHAAGSDESVRVGDIRCVGGGEDPRSREGHVSILSAAWNPHHPLQLCCGLADGAIALFDLESHLTAHSSDSSSSYDKHYPQYAQAQSEIDSTSNGGCEVEKVRMEDIPRSETLSGQPSDRNLSLCYSPTATVTPTYCLRDSVSDRKQKSSSSAAVRSASFCPYHPNLLLSSGYSSDVKVWNTKNPSNPLHLRTFPVENGWIYDSRWDPQGRGYFVGCSDSSAVRNSTVSTSTSTLSHPLQLS
jgi:hypothetical protein